MGTFGDFVERLLVEHKRTVMLAAASALLLCLSVAALFYGNSAFALRQTAASITQQIAKQETDIRQLLDNKGLLDSLMRGNYTQEQFEVVVTKPYTLLIYNRADQLIFWNNNEIIPPVRWYEDFRDGISYEKLVNAYCQIYIRRYGNEFDDFAGAKVAALFPLKYQYKQENRYLVNQVNPLLGESNNIVFTTNKEIGAIPVGFEGTNKPMYIHFDYENKNTYINWLVVYLQLGSLFLFLLFANRVALFTNELAGKKYALAVFYGCVLLVVAIGLVFNLPSTIMQYAPHSTNTGNARVLTTAIIAVALSVWVGQFTHSLLAPFELKQIVRQTKWVKWSIYSALLTVLLALAIGINYVLRLLIMQYDAKIELAQLISPQAPSVVAIVSGVGLYYILYRYLQMFVAWVEQLHLSIGQYLSGLLLVLGLLAMSYTVLPYYPEHLLIVVAISGFIVALGFFSTTFNRALESKIAKFGWLTLFTLFASGAVYLQTIDKENTLKRRFAATLREDKQFEKDFEIEANIIINEDDVINNFFLRQPLLPVSELVKRITSKYLSKFKAKYGVKNIVPFTCDGKPLDARNNLLSLAYYEELLYVNSINTSTNFLYLIPNEYGGYYYLAKMPVFYSENCFLPGFLIIELEPKTLRSESIYPELITENNNNFNREAPAYSFAIYQNGLLENFKGTYAYEAEQPAYLKPADIGNQTNSLKLFKSKNRLMLVNPADTLPSSTINHNGYAHLLMWGASYLNSDSIRLLKEQPPKTIVVSAQHNRLTAIVGLFTFLFALAIITFLLKEALRFSNFKGKGLNPFKQLFYGNIESRISISLMAVFLVTMLPLIALPTYVFYKNSTRRYAETLLVKQKNVLSSLNTLIDQKRQELSMRDKLINAVLSYTNNRNNPETNAANMVGGVENELENKIDILSDTLELNLLVNKVATTFDIDINIYDLSGDNIATSSPDVFEKELKSRKMNPTALSKLNTDKQNQFIHTESIGKLQYLSAYIPIKDETSRENKAYLNLPYYARQRDFTREFSDFLLANSYLYLILFIAGIVSSYVASQKIIEPLKLIGSKLRSIKLGQKNERLQWQHDDEIGIIINQYNQAIEELEKSAQKLAESERQSAWKQIASQVIHEFNTPLTPIKNRMELLQTALKDNHPKLQYHIQKSTEVVLEQIEVLESIIANFREFNQMPEARMEYFDLLKLLQNEVNLYSQTGAVSYHIQANIPDEPCLVYADKNQTVRVFNNLLKNAIEAIADEPDGLITVTATLQNNKVQVAIADNGHGIPEDIQPKIFQASFTTKSKGSGIGLAMSRQIIHSFNGALYFTSAEAEGTTFFVELPLQTNTQPQPTAQPEEPITL